MRTYIFSSYFYLSVFFPRLKYRTHKIAKKSPFEHHRTTLSRYIFATNRPTMFTWGDRKKTCYVKQRCLPHMSSQYGELRPTSGWDLLASLVSRLGRVKPLTHEPSRRPVVTGRRDGSCVRGFTALHSSSGHQPNCAALNRGRTYIRQGSHHVGHWPTFLV